MAAVEDAMHLKRRSRQQAAELELRRSSSLDRRAAQAGSSRRLYAGAPSEASAAPRQLPADPYELLEKPLPQLLAPEPKPEPEGQQHRRLAGAAPRRAAAGTGGSNGSRRSLALQVMDDDGHRSLEELRLEAEAQKAQAAAHLVKAMNLEDKSSVFVRMHRWPRKEEHTTRGASLKAERQLEEREDDTPFGEDLPGDDTALLRRFKHRIARLDTENERPELQVMPWGGKRVKPPDKGRATGVGGVGGAMEPLPKASGRSVRGLLALERKQNDELRFTIERWEEAAEAERRLGVRYAQLCSQVGGDREEAAAAREAVAKDRAALKMQATFRGHKSRRLFVAPNASVEAAGARDAFLVRMAALGLEWDERSGSGSGPELGSGGQSGEEQPQTNLIERNGWCKGRSNSLTAKQLQQLVLSNRVGIAAALDGLERLNSEMEDEGEQLAQALLRMIEQTKEAIERSAGGRGGSGDGESELAAIQKNTARRGSIVSAAGGAGGGGAGEVEIVAPLLSELFERSPLERFRSRAKLMGTISRLSGRSLREQADAAAGGGLYLRGPADMETAEEQLARKRKALMDSAMGKMRRAVSKLRVTGRLNSFVKPPEGSECVDDRAPRVFPWSRSPASASHLQSW